MEASNDIDSIYTRICELINSIKIYVDNNLDILAKIKDNVNSDEIHFSIKFVLSGTEKFILDRQELSSLHIRALQLYSKYSTILLATLNAFERLQKINNSVQKVTNKMWILAPTIDINNPEYLHHYLNYVEEEKYKALSMQCEESSLYVSGMAGYVRGKLTANIAEKNISMLFSIIKNANLFLSLWTKVKKLDKKYTKKRNR
jgi:hypothetical protein